MNDNIKVITFRVPQDEYDLLEWYCKETTQTKTAVLRELVRTLDPTCFHPVAQSKIRARGFPHG